MKKIRKKKIKIFQYAVCSSILIWGAIDSLIQLIGLVTNPGWSASYRAPFLWFLIVYFVPAIVVFLAFELVKRLIKR